MIADATRFLLASQNPDGGWGAFRHRRSATEPTSFALLALSRIDAAAASTGVERGVRWLREHQLADGSWPVAAGLPEGSWTTSIAAFTLATVGSDRPPVARAAAWLVGQEPAQLGLLARLLHRMAPNAMAVRLDPGLRGWPWVRGTASFVEPTAYSLLALRRITSLTTLDTTGRIDEGEALLYDRMCVGGGWNYGNSLVFDQALPPFADITALALTALRARSAQRAENRLGLELLPRLMDRAGSGLAMAWGTICLDVHDLPAAEWRRRLAARYNETGFFGDVKAVGLSALACARGAVVFRT